MCCVPFLLSCFECHSAWSLCLMKRKQIYHQRAKHKEPNNPLICRGKKTIFFSDSDISWRRLELCMSATAGGRRSPREELFVFQEHLFRRGKLKRSRGGKHMLESKGSSPACAAHSLNVPRWRSAPVCSRKYKCGRTPCISMHVIFKKKKKKKCLSFQT